jgi:predicted RNA-binding Zn-ribbon protein involved in translation (DUF1610 family)
VDILDLLRRQASRFQCPQCGETLADCKIDLVAQMDAKSLVKVTCGHCHNARLIAVAAGGPSDETRTPVRDQPIEPLGSPITTDEVLDVRLALAQFEGDFKSLVD